MSDLTTAVTGGSETGTGFRHELYPYDGDVQFLTGALAFIDDALTGGELVLVAVSAEKERILRERLAGTGAASGVSFLDTSALGRNPGRLIPAWQDWIAKLATGGQAVRGIGESQWGGRSVGETAELSYHEWLLNLAFASSPAWWLLCPYDTTVVEPAVLEAAGRCHPYVFAEGAHGASPGYLDQPYAFEPLPVPGEPCAELSFGSGELAKVREWTAARASEHGLDGSRLRELLVAVTEVAANSVKHGGGRGTLRAWTSDSTLICEFHDSGYLADPLVGRVRPTLDQIGGRGLWLVHQLCDLVQIRSTAESGTTIRLHTSLS